MIDSQQCKSTRTITTEQILEFVKISVKDYSLKTHHVDYAVTWKTMSKQVLCADVSLIDYMNAYGYTLHPCVSKDIETIRTCAKVFKQDSPPALEVF